MKATAVVIQVNTRNVSFMLLYLMCIPENNAPEPEPTPQYMP